MGMIYNYRFRIAKISIKVISQIKLFIDESMENFAEPYDGIEDRVIYIEKARDEFVDSLLNEYTEEKIYCDEDIEVYANENGYISLHKMKRKGRNARLVSAEKGKQTFIYGDEAFCEMFETEGKFYKYLSIDKILAEFDGFYLHSSLIKYKGETIVFSGPSGIGKSTQADLWKKHKNAEILNGDRSIVRMIDGEFYAYGSPFAGSSNIYINDGGKINSIVFLEQSKNNSIRCLDETESFKKIYSQSMLNSLDKNVVTMAVDTMMRLVNKVPVFEMSCLPNVESVEIVEDKCEFLFTK